MASFGCQTFSISSTAATVTTAATTSVSSTAKKLEVTNWAAPKATPATRATGQVCFTPRRPSTINTSSSGTMSAMNGVWRPAIEERSCSGRPVTPFRAMIGAAMAPNATGAVLASSDTTADFNGFMPAAISMAAEIATGAPKPARDSSRAPKQNAIRMERIRRSFEMERMVRPSTSNQGVATVSR
ncbi:hypothetical protein D9M72_447400 [compost metagenome]